MDSYCLPVEAEWREVDEYVLSFVSPARQRMVLSYRFSIDQKLSLYAALLTRMVLSLHTGIPPRELKFFSKQFCKPRLLEPAHCYFNFAHTRNCILLCVSTKGPVGADVEKISPAPLELMEKLFHPAEIAYVNQTTQELERSIRFFTVWTRIEAYMKSSGKPIWDSISSINLLDAKFAPHYHSWMQDEYVFAGYSAVAEGNTRVHRLTEADVQRYFCIDLD